MKTGSLPIVIALAVNLAAPSVVRAQTPPAPAGGGAVAATKAVADEPKIELIEIPEAPVREAVELLHEILQGEAHPPINILFSPGVGEKVVPQLRLRNVTGPDALRLLVTAAECELEVILGADELKPRSPFTRPDQRPASNVIGYRIVGTEPVAPQVLLQQPRATSALSSRYQWVTVPPDDSTIRRDSTTVATFPGSAFAPQMRPAPSPQLPASSKNPPQTPPKGVNEGADPFGSAGTTGASMASMGGGRAVGGMMGMSAQGMGADPYGQGPPDTPTTRVYALAGITSLYPFKDVEQTLLEFLQVNGSKPDESKIVLHEKTNVLLVRGLVRVHDLVAQLIESLEKNVKEAETGKLAQAERRYQSLASEIRLREQQSELKLQDANQRREEAEAEARELQKRLRGLEDQLKSKQ